MTREDLLKERKDLTEGLEIVIEALGKIEEGLIDYELKDKKYPTIPICYDDAMDCPSWFIFNAVCDTKKALKLLEKEGDTNE